jgi:ElaB/YqjD/DUF883 family membrane-anchored ribosome-binding protein
MMETNGATVTKDEPSRWRAVYQRAVGFSGKAIEFEHTVVGKVGETIKKYPLTAVAVAMGAGFLFGRLLRRR